MFFRILKKDLKRKKVMMIEENAIIERKTKKRRLVKERKA